MVLFEHSKLKQIVCKVFMVSRVWCKEMTRLIIDIFNFWWIIIGFLIFLSSFL